MASYKLIASRWLRQYSEAKTSPVYATETEVAYIASHLCDVPWKRVSARDATMTWHTNDIVHTEGEEPNVRSWTGLQWNLRIRDEFDAALFCADHVGGGHKAQANAACYRYVLPDGAVGKTLQQVVASVTSDPYNAVGARIALLTNSTGEIPMDCATCRNGGRLVNGSYVQDASYHTADGGVVKRRVEIAADGSETWYPKTENVTLTPIGFVLQKYLFVFVLLENYNVARGNWIEGSSFVANSIQFTLNQQVDGWTEGDLIDCSSGGADDDVHGLGKVVVTKDGVIADVRGVVSPAVYLTTLMSGTRPSSHEDGTVGVPAQVTDELLSSNLFSGARTIRGLQLSDAVMRTDLRSFSPTLKNWGVGACFRLTEDIAFTDEDGNHYYPRSLAYSASSLIIPLGLPARFTGSILRANWTTWLSRNVPVQGSKFNFWLKPGDLVDGMPDEDIVKHALYDATEKKVGDWVLLGSVSAASGTCDVDLPGGTAGKFTLLVTAYVPEDAITAPDRTVAGTSDFMYDGVSVDGVLPAHNLLYPLFGQDTDYYLGDLMSRNLPIVDAQSSWFPAYGVTRSSRVNFLGFSGLRRLSDGRAGFAATDRGLYVCGQGALWRHVEADGSYGKFTAAAFLSNIAVAAGPGIALAAVDSPYTWGAIPGSANLGIIALAATGSDTIVAGTQANGIYQIDRGTSYYDPSGWTWVQSNVTSGRFESFVLTGNTGIAAGSSGIYRRNSQSSDWTVSKTSSRVFSFTRVRNYGSFALAFSDNGVMKSTDSGGTWVRTGLVGSACYDGVLVGGLVVVAGETGLWAAKSNDLDDWTLVCPEAIGAKQVVYAAQKWVVASRSGIFVSVDGLEWKHVDGIEADLTGVAYGDSRWVVVGASSMNFSSADAITWEQGGTTMRQTTSAGTGEPIEIGDIDGIRFLSDRWIIYGGFGIGYSVADAGRGSGRSWISVRAENRAGTTVWNSMGRIRDVVRSLGDGGFIVAVGELGVWYNRTGVDGWSLWYHAGDDENQYGNLFSAYADSAGVCLVGGSSGVWKSTDGSTWTDTGTNSSSISTSHIPGISSAICAFGWDSSAGTRCAILTQSGGAYYLNSYERVCVACSVSNEGSYRRLLYDDSTHETTVSGDDGLFLSTDYGANWTATNINDKSPRLDPLVRVNGVWIAGSIDGSAGIYRSVDGLTWEETAVSTGKFTCACVDDSGVVYVAGADGLRVSADAGITWSEPVRGIPEISSIAFDDGMVVVGTVEGVLYCTPRNFEAVGLGGISVAIQYYNYVVTNGSNCVIATVMSSQLGIRYSKDNGRTWRWSDNIRTSNVTSIAAGPTGKWLMTADGATYGDQYHGAYLSTDYGANWAQVYTSDAKLAAYGASKWLVVPSSYGSMQYSTDDGSTWTPCTGAPSSGINDILYAGSKFIMAADDGIYSSTDGVEWTKVHSSGGVRVFYDSVGKWIVTRSGGVSYSTDGTTWTNYTLSLLRATPIAAYAGGFWHVGSIRGYSGIVMWVSDCTPVSQSDPTITWVKVMDNSTTALSFTSMVAKGNQLVVGTTGHGILYSSAVGTDLVLKYSALSTPNIYAIGLSGSTLVIPASTALYVGTDAAAGLEPASCATTGITSMKKNGDRWVAGLDGLGLIISDNGFVWTSVLTAGTVNAIEYGGNNMWLAAFDVPLLAGSKDGGKSWSTVSSSLPEITVLDYHGGVWVASTPNGPYYSTDQKFASRSTAMTWRAATGGSAFTSVSYDDGVWLATVADGGIIRSTDGKTWTATSLTTRTYVPPVKAFGAWYTGCSSTADGIRVSTDGGLTWNKITFPTETGAGYVYSMRFASGALLVAKSAGAARVVVTRDGGQTWTPVAPDTFTGRDIIISSYKGRWVVALQKQVYVSCDLINWNALAIAELGSNDGSYSKILDVGGALVIPRTITDGLSETTPAFYRTVGWTPMSSKAFRCISRTRVTGAFDPSVWEEVENPVRKRSVGEEGLCVPDIEIYGEYA